jgi:predicted nucleotidyltransferase
MRQRIIEALRWIEHKEKVKILVAVEAGSRAWGFESPDSDFDVRYVYVRRPTAYLEIDDRRDVIDHYHQQPYIQGSGFDDPLLDITGWDVKKALQLLRKGSPQLQEWLNSTTIYIEGQRQSLLDLSNSINRFEPVYMFYRSMAANNFRTYLQGDMVRYKKYLYVIRPLLAAQWVVTYRTFPPVDFRTLLLDVIQQYETMFPHLREAIERLLERKAKASELEDAPRDEVLHEWIRWEFDRKPHQMDDPVSDPTPQLNSFFHRVLCGKELR